MARRFEFLSVLSVLLLAACAGPAEKPFEPPVFPPPPDEPRFVFERMVTSSADLKEVTAGDRFRMLATGERVVGIGFGKPFDVAACRGRMYVSDTVSRTVMVYDIPGRRFFKFGETEPGALHQPLGLDTDAECNVFVADATGKAVRSYTKDGQFIRSFGGDDMFHRLSHVAVSPDGARLFAVDTGGVGTEDHRVRVFDARSGEHLYDFGSRGTGEGQFNLPRDASVGPDQLVYVVDGGNFRIQVFRQDGSYVRSFGQVGRQTGQFSRPKGVDLDPAGNVYVSDAAFGNFQIFTPEGQLLLFVGGRSGKLEPARFMLPAGISVDEDGRVYMVDQFFRKVDVFRPAALPKEAGYLGAWWGSGN